MDLRIISQTRQFTYIAVIETPLGRNPLRTEVVRHNKTDSYFCRACKTADSCRHVAAARRFLTRPQLAVMR